MQRLGEGPMALRTQARLVRLRITGRYPDLRRPLDISIDRDGLFCISEGGVSGLSPRVSLMDPQGQVVARWDSLSAHGSWIDARGDIYLALGARMRVDKYTRQS